MDPVGPSRRRALARAARCRRAATRNMPRGTYNNRGNGVPHHSRYYRAQPTTAPTISLRTAVSPLMYVYLSNFVWSPSFASKSKSTVPHTRSGHAEPLPHTSSAGEGRRDSGAVRLVRRAQDVRPAPQNSSAALSAPGQIPAEVLQSIEEGSADAALQLEAHQLVHLCGKLHRQLVEDVAAEA